MHNLDKAENVIIAKLKSFNLQYMKTRLELAPFDAILARIFCL